ncbi:ATP-binding protein [Clostridium hydrogenum]|uniref:ATP-binding protein n=1 Tax=Clostridium hydrogenum TaxID=2855764 RepID=UPI001F1AB5BF|nr:ATP-binding protein [Clostridium hydrogenum]
MKYTLVKSYRNPILCSKSGIITEINAEFVSFSGYSESELIGKSLTEISSMLRMDSQVYLENIEDEYKCYIFTKELKPREVTISCKFLEFNDERKYFFKERINSRIEDRFLYLDQLGRDNKIAVAIYSVPDLIVLKANTKILHYANKKNIIGKKLRQIAVELKLGDVEARFLEIIKAKKSCYNIKFKYNILGSGTTYWDVELIPIYVEEKVKYLIQTIRNETEKVLNRKIIEKQSKVIAEQKEELEAIIENVSDGIIICDKNGQYKRFNKVLRNTFFNDYTEKITPDTVFEKAEYFDRYGKLISKGEFPSRRVIKGEKLSGYRFDIKINNKLICKEESGTPIYDNKGNLIFGVLIIRDISERLKNQECLLIKAQYDVLNNLIENFALGYIKITLTDFKINYINTKGYNHLKLGYNGIGTIESIIGKKYFDVFNCDAEEEIQFKTGIQDLTDRKIESFSMYKKVIISKEERFFRFVFQPIFGLNNQVTELVSTIIDITKEVRAKNKMERTLKVQDEIFSNIAHELKTPLNVIFSTNQLIELYLKNDCLDANKLKVAKFISMIKQNCYRFTRLINNIVDLSKIESGAFKLNLSNENIVEVTEDIVQSVAEYVKSKGLNIIFDTDTEEKIISCDPDKIERIILNLISNAIKFTDTGGVIYINLIDKGNDVEISVKDTGIGMDKKQLNDIFKRFHQIDKSLSRNAEGSGIGLSLVKSITEMHGGEISVESEVGKGSIFKIQLPVKTLRKTEIHKEIKNIKSKIEMINIEFSDIYSI